MTVKELIVKHARENGYDGLVEPFGECGCEIDDICPCGDMKDVTDCEFGYKVPCDCDCCEGDCDLVMHNMGQWHITTEKPEPKALTIDEVVQRKGGCPRGNCES